MSTAKPLSWFNRDLLDKLETWLAAREDECSDLKAQLADVRELRRLAEEEKADLEKQLAAAEKRAEEAEAKLREWTSRASDAAGPHRAADRPICLEEWASKDRSVPTQPQEPEPRYHGMTRAEHEAAKVRDDNGRLYCPTCAADDAEARRDAKMEGP